MIITSTNTHKWLVTGVAGFIGSNILLELLTSNQRVVGLDNFSTGHWRNLEQIKTSVRHDQWQAFQFIEGDICNLETCRTACKGIDYVLHQAALGSVPRSLQDPISSHQSNVSGFLNMLVAARDSDVQRFVYASSSAVYGDHPVLPKTEENTGRILSPYAATKAFNESYASLFTRCYGLSCVGLRYFNVFGPRQDPDGQYAAVIPKWITAILENVPVVINGDCETSRDFCYVANVVQANIRAATTNNRSAVNQIYNIAVGSRTTLNELFALLRNGLAAHTHHLQDIKPIYRDFRAGDVYHSQAAIDKARGLLGYYPTHDIEKGLSEALPWYVQQWEISRAR